MSWSVSALPDNVLHRAKQLGTVIPTECGLTFNGSGSDVGVRILSGPEVGIGPFCAKCFPDGRPDRPAYVVGDNAYLAAIGDIDDWARHGYRVLASW